MDFVQAAPPIEEEHVQEWSIGPDPMLKNRVIDDVIHFLSKKYSLGPSVLFKYRLCLDEAITNAITHGCRGVEDPKVQIDFHWSPSQWAIRIVDPGAGFDPATIPDPTDPGNEYREQGRGILILQRYTDRLLFAQDGRELVFWMKTDELSS